MLLLPYVVEPASASLATGLQRADGLFADAVSFTEEELERSPALSFLTLILPFNSTVSSAT